jgi:hypothetical protein
VLRDADVLGEAALREQRKHLLTGAECGHVLSGRLDLARHVTAENAAFGGAQAQAARHQAGDIRLASHVMPVVGVDGRGEHPDQHLIAGGHRFIEVGELQQVW